MFLQVMMTCSLDPGSILAFVSGAVASQDYNGSFFFPSSVAFVEFAMESSNNVVSKAVSKDQEMCCYDGNNAMTRSKDTQEFLFSWKIDLS